MPDERTVRRWADDIAEFKPQYARAREEGLDAMADELIGIADEEPGVTALGSTDGGAVQHQRLRVDTRKWYLSKLAPKRYGDKLEVEHSGTIDVATRIIAARKRAGG